jgi:hypothetical protein
MSKFRQRPVVIDAVQFFPDKRPWPDGVEVGSHPKNPYFVRTVQGTQLAFPGDWIITGVKGEHFPCKPDIFLAMFDGCSMGIPALNITPSPAPEDKEFHRSEGENWWDPVVINDDSSLHEELHNRG